MSFRSLVLLALLCLIALIGSSTTTLEDEKEIEKKSTLLLPSLEDQQVSTDPTVRKLNIGEKVGMEELGPIIINPDGTTRRISNWNNLTDFEKERTWKRISARNRDRISNLQQKDTPSSQTA